MKKTHVILGSVLLISSASGFAQIINATDNAGNYSSWTSGSTGGSGFGTWTFNNATPNGGYSGEFLGSSGTSMDTGGNSFGMYANGGASAEAQAVRSFSGGALVNNQTFSINMQNNGVTDNGGQVGFDLQNSSGVNLFQFYFAGGGSDYQINVGGVQVDTGVGYTSSPLSLSFSQGAGDAWSFSINSTTLSSTSTGNLLSSTGISQLDLYSLNGGSSRTMGDNGNLYFNNFEIVTAPEPSSLVLLGVSGLITLVAIRRRR